MGNDFQHLTLIIMVGPQQNLTCAKSTGLSISACSQALCSASVMSTGRSGEEEEEGSPWSSRVRLEPIRVIWKVYGIKLDKKDA